jgi:hypothetical protein
MGSPARTDDMRTEGPVTAVAPFPTTAPPGFVQHEHTHRWEIDRPRSAVWAWLCDPATFVDGQVWPFRVEFLSDATGRSGFSQGVYNAHVGPFISFAGVLGEIEPERYRDLQYFYGSYAISHGLFRPTRLQFWLDDGATPGTTVLHLKIDSFARKRFDSAWSRLMGVFWARFGRWCEKAVPATAARQ